MGQHCVRVYSELECECRYYFQLANTTLVMMSQCLLNLKFLGTNHPVYRCKSLDFEERAVECRNCTTVVSVVKIHAAVLMQICAPVHFVHMQNSSIQSLPMCACARAHSRIFLPLFLLFPFCCFECSQIKNRSSLITVIYSDPMILCWYNVVDS